MAMGSKKALSKAKAVSNALDELELKLEPLFSQSLQETSSSLDTLQEAKLNVLLPYLIDDLVFIYLKCRGVDPKSHPVVNELERVRQYFAKIKDAEQSDTKKRSAIDKAAAGRFIKHAIAQAKQNMPSTPSEPVEPEDRQEGTSKALDLPPTKVTEKMRQREAFLKELREADEAETDDEPCLEIFEDEEEEKVAEEGEGKETAIPPAKEATPNAKKRRRPIDPFTGAAEGSSTPAGPKKKSKKIAQLIGENTPSSSRASSVSDGTQDSNSQPSEKKKKRKKKKSIITQGNS